MVLMAGFLVALRNYQEKMSIVVNCVNCLNFRK